jgi:hypothetical protein
MKQALVYELNNDFKAALDSYTKIKRDFPNSTEARQIGTYIARTQALLN